MATEISLKCLKIPGEDAAWNVGFEDAITFFGTVHECRQTFSDHKYRDENTHPGFLIVPAKPVLIATSVLLMNGKKGRFTKSGCWIIHRIIPDSTNK
jgi:hypothetical protein